MTKFDVAIVGAGIAGAGLAANLARYCSVLLLEGENQPGYHATGRSAAFWDECYGGPNVQPLTTASGPFLLEPPADFHDRPLMTPRGALYIARANEADLATALQTEFSKSGVKLKRLDGSELAAHIPGLRSGWTEALWGASCCDIDVAALHGAFLRSARRAGAHLQCNAELLQAGHSSGGWNIETTSGHFEATTLVNAAGAWADMVAQRSGIRPLDVQPYRRTIVQLEVDPAVSSDLPLVIGLDGSFYFKPDSGGRLWLSPHDETATPACDAAPEELDIAIAIDRLQQVVDWRIKRVEHSWAGLRSFAPDRLPVIGRDLRVPDFFWLAGQGGFGIQTAPAASRMAASLIADAVSMPDGVDAALYDPKRFG